MCIIVAGCNSQKQYISLIKRRLKLKLAKTSKFPTREIFNYLNLYRSYMNPLFRSLHTQYLHSEPQTYNVNDRQVYSTEDRSIFQWPSRYRGELSVNNNQGKQGNPGKIGKSREVPDLLQAKWRTTTKSTTQIRSNCTSGGHSSL